MNSKHIKYWSCIILAGVFNGIGIGTGFFPSFIIAGGLFLVATINYL